jgi:hypothetical protein
MDEIHHFGIKGMRWGHHKLHELTTPSKDQIKSVVQATGQRSKKIAVTTSQVISYAAHHKRTVAGAAVLGLLLRDVGIMTVRVGKTGILFKAAKNRQAAYEAGKLAARALSSTAAKVNYAKLVKGAYKITTL